MDNDNFLLAIAVIAVLISFVGFSVTYNSVSSFQNFLTGFATEDNGTVNLTISNIVAINITHAGGSLGETLDFGTGSVSGGGVAILATNDSGSCTNCVGWSTYPIGFTVNNIGNNDVALNITGVTATTFLGDGTGEEFEFNFTNNESGSCSQWNLASAVNNTFTEFDGVEDYVCDVFNFEDSTDTINIDFRIVVPSDLPTSGAKGAIIQLAFE